MVSLFVVLVGISAVVHLMGTILPSSAKFYKDVFLIKTLGVYCFLFGVLVGYWLGLVGLYRDCIGVL